MAKKSAGILLYRFPDKNCQFLLVHPGGPFWANKDEGAWSIPKGEMNENENMLDAAIREMEEETGYKATGPFIELSPVKQKSGKMVYTFAAEGDFDPNNLVSNTCFVEWPPHTNRRMEIPEVDRAGWFYFDSAKKKIGKGQLPILIELVEKLEKFNLK